MTDWKQVQIRLSGMVLILAASGCMRGNYQTAYVPGAVPEMAGSTVALSQPETIYSQPNSAPIAVAPTQGQWSVGALPGSGAASPVYGSDAVVAGFASPYAGPSGLTGAYYSIPSDPRSQYPNMFPAHPQAGYTQTLPSNLAVTEPRVRPQPVPEPRTRPEPAKVPFVHAEPIPEPRYRPVPSVASNVPPQIVPEPRVRPEPAGPVVQNSPVPDPRVRPVPTPEPRTRPLPPVAALDQVGTTPAPRVRPEPAISPLAMAQPTPEPRTRPEPAVPQSLVTSNPFDNPVPQLVPGGMPAGQNARPLASDYSLAWAAWPFTRSTVPPVTPAAGEFANARALLPYRIAARPGSKAEKFYRARMAANTTTAAAQGDPFGGAAIARPGLQYRGGRTMPEMAYLNLYIGGEDRWKQQDVLKIDAAILAAMNDQHLNAALAPYFRGKTLSTVALPSHPLPGPLPEKITRADIHESLRSLHTQGYFEDYDLQDTVFNFLCPTDMVLADDTAEVDSLDGLTGYHGSLPVGKDTVYYTVVVAAVKRMDGTENGLPAFPEAWKNTAALLYHQLQKVRTNPDCEDVLREPANPEVAKRLGWTADTGDEIGDVTLREAKSLETVIQEVSLADGTGSVPVLLLDAAPAENEEFAPPVIPSAIPALIPADIPADIPSEIPAIVPAQLPESTEAEPEQASPFP